MKQKIKLLLLVPIIVFVGWMFWAYGTRGKVLLSPLAQSFESITLVNKLGNFFKVKGVPIEEGDNIRVNIDNWQVIFSKNKDLDLQVSALQLVATRLRMDEEKTLEIDLRYQKVVIKNL